MNEELLNKYYDLLAEGIMNYGPKLISAMLMLIVGLRVIKWLTRLVRKALTKSSLSPEITGFIATFFDIIVKAFLLLIVAGLVGIDTASLVAVLAAAGFAIGLALQGSLSNFAAGILILLFKPYRVGDYVEMLDKFGKIVDIQVFNTIMETPGNKTLIVPNGKVIDGIITNVSEKGNIRLELTVTIPYSEDWERVQIILENVLLANDKVLTNPVAEIGILSYDSHNILVGVRPFVMPEDFWDVRFQIYAQIKKAFHDNNVQVAYSEGVEIGKIGK